jgi:hypothetical protein
VPFPPETEVLTSNCWRYGLAGDVDTLTMPRGKPPAGVAAPARGAAYEPIHRSTMRQTITRLCAVLLECIAIIPSPPSCRTLQPLGCFPGRPCIDIGVPGEMI